LILRDVIALHLENHAKHTNTLCVHNADFLVVMHNKLSYHFALYD